MCDAVVFLMSDGEGDSSIVFSHRLDEGFESFCDYGDVIVWVGCFVADDGFAEGNGVVNLGLGGMYRFKD